MNYNFEFSETLITGIDSFMDESFHAIDDYSNFSNGGSVDYGGIATATAEVGTQIAGVIASSKASKEASKSDLQKFVDFRCGKDKSKSWSKGKKQQYLDCKATAQKDYENKAKNVNVQNQQKQLSLKLAQEKNKQRNTYLIIGGIVLIVGYLYFKNKK